MAQIACLHCDLLIEAVEIAEGDVASCPRCHQVIYLDKQSYSSALALLFTALLLYFPAVFLPFLNMETIGANRQISLFESVQIIAHDELIVLAITVFLLVIFLPLVRLVGLLLIVISLARGRLPFGGQRSGMRFIRWLLAITPWCMMEVYLVGTIVTLIKLMALATIEFSNGFYAFLVLIFINALISAQLPKKRIWQDIATLKMTPLTAVVSLTQNDEARQKKFL